MGLTWEDIALWIAGLATLAALFLVLVGRKRAGQFPFFTILVGFDALQSAIFYFAVKNQPLYFYSYWGGCRDRFTGIQAVRDLGPGSAILLDRRLRREPDRCSGLNNCC
jgi:hypothetical protein